MARAARPARGARGRAEAPAAPARDETVTTDALLRGRVALLQPARGFRSSLDPVLLAGFLAPPYGRFLDIGCGTGALSFLLLAADTGASGVAVEVQPRLARLATAGSVRNGFSGRLDVLEADVRAAAPPWPAGRFDLVATNPPFRPLGRGLVPPDRERAVAHHELHLSLPEWLDAAARAVRPGGRVGVVFPAERAAELLAAALARGLSPERLRPVYPAAGRPAVRVLVEARRVRTARPLRVEPPLVVHESGRYGPDVRRMLGE